MTDWQVQDGRATRAIAMRNPRKPFALCEYDAIGRCKVRGWYVTEAGAYAAMAKLLFPAETKAS